MSTIHNHPVWGHFLGSPTEYVIHLRNGQVRHQGVGQAFWFARGTSVVSEVPATDQESLTWLHAVTLDQQKISAQINVAFRFSDPVLASQRLDFSVFPVQAAAGTSGREQIGTIVGQLVQSVGVDLMAGLTVAQALETGVDKLHSALTEALPADARLQSTGVGILGVRVLAIRPDDDIEKALQAPVREQLQAEADRATYERRAKAVERELAISANELSSKIELATQREKLVAQEGTNNRREAEQAATAAMITARSEAERREVAAQAKASETNLVGEAEAAKEGALMNVYTAAGRDVLIALALREGGLTIPTVSNLTVTPDLLTGLLSRLTGVAGNEGA